jgi:hypothetical protein
MIDVAERKRIAATLGINYETLDLLLNEIANELVEVEADAEALAEAVREALIEYDIDTTRAKALRIALVNHDIRVGKYPRIV